jgi:hypothetical protein
MGSQEHKAMKLFTGWLATPAVAALAATGAVFAVTGVQAQVLAPYEIDQPAIVVSDMSGPYAAMLPGPVQEYGPRLLPAPEVYTVVRDNGFSPLGMPRQRGFVYTIAVINRNGDDGRLVIDARDGRIVRFVPAYLAGDHVSDDLTATYGPVGPPPRVIEARRGPPRPPAPIPRHYASRTLSSVPLPRPAPHAVVAPKHVTAKQPAAAPPVQQSASVQEKPAGTAPATTTSAAAAAPVEAKPGPAIEPTKDMPPVQGFN